MKPILLRNGLQEAVTHAANALTYLDDGAYYTALSRAEMAFESLKDILADADVRLALVKVHREDQKVFDRQRRRAARRKK